MTGNENIHQEIKTIVAQWFKYYSEKNLEKVLEKISRDDNVVFIGTESDELAKGFNQIEKGFKKDFKLLENISVSLDFINISTYDSVCIVTAREKLSGKFEEQNINIDGRLSLVLKYDQEQWQIIHFHLSVPNSSIQDYS